MSPLFVESQLLKSHGFLHAFSTRHGGDDREALALACGIKKELWVEVDQVHGTHVVDVELARCSLQKADAICAILRSKRPNRAIGIRTADCMPILLGNTRTRSVLAIHAGWRGLVDGVVRDSIRHFLLQDKGNVSELVLAVGPHISVRAFEVGPEVAVRFSDLYGHECVVQNMKPHVDMAVHVDLGIALHKEIEALGISRIQLDVVPGCTFLEPKLFHSFRRDKERAGRQISLAVCGG